MTRRRNTTAMVPYQQKMSAGTLIAAVASSTDWSQVANWVYNNAQYLNSMGYSTQGALTTLKRWWNGSQQSPNSGAVTNAPVAQSRRVRVFKPRVTGVKGGVTIRHREYVADVAGNTTFGVTSFTIQPGLAASSPWLSGIANNLEKYRVKSMSLQYINVAATDERGRITLAFDRGPLNDDPETKAAHLSYKGPSEGPVWPSPILTEQEGTDIFTRNGTVTGTDLKTYDYGKFLVGVSNTADTAVVGELFINYEIELTIPQPAACSSAFVYAATGTTKTVYFGTDPSITGSAPITVSSGTMTFHAPGDYWISTYAFGTSPGTIDYATGTVTFGANKQRSTDGSTSTRSIAMFAVRATAPGQTLILSTDGTTTSITETVVTMVSNGVYGA